jgi:hypothetical protein
MKINSQRSIPVQIYTIAREFSLRSPVGRNLLISGCVPIDMSISPTQVKYISFSVVSISV